MIARNGRIGGRILNLTLFRDKNFIKLNGRKDKKEEHMEEDFCRSERFTDRELYSFQSPNTGSSLVDDLPIRSRNLNSSPLGKFVRAINHNLRTLLTPKTMEAVAPLHGMKKLTKVVSSPESSSKFVLIPIIKRIR